MLSVMLSCFLSFAVVGGQYVDASIQTRAANYSPSWISYEEMEVEMYRPFPTFVGRHVFVKIDDYEYMGTQVVGNISGFHDGDAFYDVTVTEETSKTETISLSTTRSLSASIISGLGVKAGIPGVEVSADAKVSTVYTISDTITYTTSNTTTVTITYNIVPEYIEGKIFAVGWVGEIYKLSCQTWEVDDYIWGDYEVSGSRQSFDAYVVVNPYVTIIYQDGSFVGS